jgi:hypothetical protein
VKKRMKRTKVLILVLACSLTLSSSALLPVKAEDILVNSNAWFVLVLTGATGFNVSYSDGGTVLHDIGNYTWNLMQSPPGVAGTIQIGTAKSVTSMDFNNVTNRGNTTIRLSLNFTDTNSTRNPYGVGTIEAIATANLNATYPSNAFVVGNGTGTLTSTSGTGAFKRAVLTGDLVLTPFAFGTQIAEGLFFGTHPRVNGKGLLTYYSPIGASAFCSVTVWTGWKWYFFVQSVGGVGSHTYQWYEGNATMQGQTSTVLSVTKSVAGAYTYYCQVTDSDGASVNSNIVTLNVLG